MFMVFVRWNATKDPLLAESVIRNRFDVAIDLMLLST